MIEDAVQQLWVYTVVLALLLQLTPCQVVEVNIALGTLDIASPACESGSTYQTGRR